MNYRRIRLNAKNTIYYTPRAAIEEMIKILPKDITIWECANGQGHITKILREYGYKVIQSDINTGQDFLTFEQKEDYDMIITNPPFNLKNKFLMKCYELEKPFLLLGPITYLESQKRLKKYKEKGISVFLPPKKIDYIKINGEPSKCPFFSMWVGYNINGYENNGIYYL